LEFIVSDEQLIEDDEFSVFTDPDTGKPGYTDARLTDLPIADVVRRLQEAGDQQSVAVIQHLQYCLWDATRSEDSHGVPDSSWDVCGICDRAEAGPGKFRGGITHAECCPLCGWESIDSIPGVPADQYGISPLD
jgi:hypothetical protein